MKALEDDPPYETDAVSQRIFHWSRRSAYANGREEAGIAITDVVCGIAATINIEEVRHCVRAALGFGDDQPELPLFPSLVTVLVARAAATADVDEELPVGEDLSRVLQEAMGSSRTFEPEALIGALFRTEHRLVVEMRALNQHRIVAPESDGARRPTPTLDELGEDLTAAAREGRLPLIVGRQDVVDLVAETLCRRIKRNPLLIGPAGVGKTAVAEALAQRIVAGEVPEPLRATRIVQIRPSVLVARSGSLAEFQEKVDLILKEAGQPGLVLFVDEVHAMVGAGGATGSTDMASLMKPALARGAIACIAATTDYEYRKHISGDAALSRRFVPLRVHELSIDETLAVLEPLRESAQSDSGLEIPPAVCEWIVAFADRHMRNRSFPDKAIDLLDQCIAHALMGGARAVTLQDARAIAQRMVGAAADPSLDQLRRELAESQLITPDDAERLAARLDVTLRGLDVRPERPNAVLLLADGAAAWSQTLSRIIAGTVAGGPERVVTLDFGSYPEAHDLARLIGAGPSYVGYGDTLPIHQLLQTPTCVLLCLNVDLCHARVRDFFGRALASGSLRDGRGDSLYLSDTVVIVTSKLDVARRRGALGFTALWSGDHGVGADLVSLDEQVVDQALERVLGPTFADEIDLVIHESIEAAAAPAEDAGLDHWLARLADRYRPHGLDLIWDESLVAWLNGHLSGMETRDVERAIDETVSRPLALLLEERSQGDAAPDRATVRVRHGPAGVEVLEEQPIRAI